jgi:uncharacterized heparinase superfamily protein
VTGVTELALLARTAVHLQPAQAAHRARLRAQRTALHRWPRLGRRLLTGPDPCAAAGWPTGFVPAGALSQPDRIDWPGRAAQPGQLPGRITLLGVTRELGNPPDWLQSGAPRLWRFHLHYWDWAWSLAAGPDRGAASPALARAVFARLWRSWHTAVTFGGGDAWLPYPAALRAWSWCGLHAALVTGGEIDGPFTAELAAHAGFLRRHLESDVGGNHLIKDLKALAGLAVFFADDRLLDQVSARLARQLAVQVLPDGGHYERSPAYHCQVLADLTDVQELISTAGRPLVPGLAGAITRMRDWLAAVLTPAGQVPLLNDGYPVAAGLLAALDAHPAAPARTPPAGPHPGPDGTAGDGAVRVLADSGLVAATAGGWHLLADIGAPCPDELPAHAHADTLSCLVHVDGAPLLVDTGTSTYEPGPRRRHERSTAAHNTAGVDGADSTEVWGAFRAARRARVLGDVTARAEPGRVTISAAHDGYRRLAGRPVHRRRWSLTADELRVDDQVTGGGEHAVAIRWQLAPGAAVRPDPERPLAVRVTGPAGSFDVTVSGPPGARIEVETAQVAAGFQRTAAAPVLTCRASGPLPLRFSTAWRRAPLRAAAARPEGGW